MAVNPRKHEIAILLAKLYYYYALIRDKEHKRRLAINWISSITCVFFLLGLLLVKLVYGPPNPGQSLLPFTLPVYFPTVAFVVWAGFIGGFMSLLVRLVNIPSRNDESTLIAEIETITKTLYSGPIIGAIFALVLYISFSGQLIEGKFFPKMASLYSSDTDTYENRQAKSLSKSVEEGFATAEKTRPRLRDPEQRELNRYLHKFVPIDAQNLALLLFWSFVAGYSQTFVPDRLKSITTKSSS